MKKTVVMVFCQYGSDGEKIARRLAEALALPFYDRESLLATVKEEETGDGFRQNSAEQGRRLFALATGSTVSSMTEGALSLSELDATVFNLETAMKQTTSDGGAVIAYDGFEMAAAEGISGIRVYIGAEREDRVKRVALREGILPSVALRKIERRDKRNARLYHLYAGHKGSPPDGYSVCINSSFLGVDGAVEAIRGVIDRRNKCG